VGICTGQDNDHDGLSYKADWPDTNPNHPSSLVIGNALDDGMGPLSFNGGSYQGAFEKIFFQPANTTAGAFYPFFSQVGTGHACVFNFGNDTSGETNDFGKTNQYGTTITNPCTGAPIAKCTDVTTSTDPNICTANPSINHGSFDTDGDPLALAQSPAGPYGLGLQTVTLKVTDSESLSASCSATIRVNDTQAPNIACPAPVVECTGPSGTAVPIVPTVSDNCPGVGVPACTPASNSVFALGVTPFSCMVADASANTRSCLGAVTVQDTTKPIVDSVSASPNVLWPPDQQFVPIAITAVAHDTCDPNPVCSIASVSSSEPLTGGGSGNSTPDYNITGPLSLALRAEREGTGSGRTYTIAVTCKDASNNVSDVASTTVFVPHSR
jgi:hypothetical protein